MTFDEALEVLGIDVTAGEEGARRAYLRLIKVHKPDRDPEAFRKVREAFDRVKGEIVWRAQWSRVAAPPEAPAAEPPPEPATPAAEAVAPMAASGSPPEFPRNAPRNLGDNRLESLKIVDLPAAVIELHGQPVLQVNERPGLHFVESVLEPLRIVPRPDLAPEPEPAPDGDPRAVRPPHPRPSPPPAERMERARLRMEAGDLGGVVDAWAAFEEARRRPEAPEPDPGTALHLSLLLFAGGRVHEGRSLVEALRQWLRSTGAERRLMGGQVAARLAVARSLADLPADTPPFPVRAIAQATLDGALDAAHAPLRTFASESPYSAAVAAEHFEAHAPLLANAFGAALRSSVPPARPAKKSGNGWMVWLWLVATLFVVRGLGNCAATPDPVTRYRVDAPRTYAPPSLPPFSMPSLRIPDLKLPPPETLRFNPLAWRVDALCATPIAQKVKEFCGLLREASLAALDRDCHAVEAALEQLEEATASHRSSRPRDYRPFLRDVRASCARKPMESPREPKQNAPEPRPTATPGASEPVLTPEDP